jgi:glycosyltransferase involved in cell wall biosynthesis
MDQSRLDTLREDQWEAELLPADEARTPTSIAAIVPLYNGARFIRTTLLSIIGQTRKPDEIIVVDDGSTDDGCEVVQQVAAEQSVAITLLHKPNGGQSSARNMGVAHAGSELIAFLDQDDMWYPDHLEQLEQPFLRGVAHRDIGWVYSDLDEVDRDGRMITRSFLSTMEVKHPKRALSDCLSSDMFVLPSASLISRKAFQKVGGFDERLSGYEDDDLFLRLFQAGYWNVYIPRALTQWRIHTASSSYTLRMAKSRMIYTRKLFEAYPNDRKRSRYFVRDVLAPRFFLHALVDFRKAFELGDRQNMWVARNEVCLLLRNLARRRRLKWAFLPALLAVVAFVRGLFPGDDTPDSFGRD